MTTALLTKADVTRITKAHRDTWAKLDEHGHLWTPGKPGSGKDFDHGEVADRDHAGDEIQFNTRAVELAMSGVEF